LSGMMPAIQLDCDPRRTACDVDNVAVDDQLPREPWAMRSQDGS
jgi:hypothetical protein